MGRIIVPIAATLQRVGGDTETDTDAARRRHNLEASASCAGARQGLRRSPAKVGNRPSWDDAPFGPVRRELPDHRAHRPAA